MKYYNILDDVINIHGLAVTKKGMFHRLPPDIRDKVNDSVTGLATNSAGGRIRFKTDSKRINVKVKLNNGGSMSHMPLSGKSGVDVLFGETFCGAIYPPDVNTTEYEGTVTRYKGIMGMFDVTVNLPLYNGIADVDIGIDDEANIDSASPYTYTKPMVFYGSSITQGGCASRPANAYPAFVSRWLHADHINLGFSGSARGEEIMAEYIASLDMSVFILDYDHNAPDVDHLKNTHEKFYGMIRSKQPNLPIVIVSKPDFDPNMELNIKRRSVLLNTYVNALNNGDRNVYYIDGERLFDIHDRSACTVDGCHPNDLGFYRMAETMYPLLKKILKNT